tara:strand:+ start:49955 stop:51601 length:1647 start_codon:yes stop_codon:yes gene_type:complete
MSLIKYNGVDLFADQIPPLVGKSVSYESNGDTRVLQLETITLNGEITGCGRDNLRTARDAVVNALSTDFKDLDISGIDILTGVKIESIDFASSPYLESVPYSIQFTHYPTGGFEIAHGVSNPSSQYSYSEGKDQKVSITHTISAQGINTDGSVLGGNALDNAKNFVTSRLMGVWEVPRPYLIGTEETEFKAYLTDYSQNIDKVSNTFSVTRNFMTDPSDVSGHVILRYTKNIEQNDIDDITISYNGVIDAGRDDVIHTLATQSKTSDGLNNIRSKYVEFKDSLDALSFIDESVNEDTGINRLTFGLSYISGSNEPPITDNFTITVEEGSDSSLFNVSINGNIFSKSGCVGTRFNDVSGYYEGDSHNFEICESIYRDFYTSAHGSTQERPDGIILNNNPLSRGKSYNPIGETMSYSASFNDRTSLHWGNENVHSMDYNMTLTPSLTAITSSPSATKTGWIFEDLGYRSRAVFSFDINSTNSVGSGDLKDLAIHQFHKMTDKPEDIKMESDSFNTGISKSVNQSWSRSFHSKYSLLDTSVSYTGISEVRI